VRTGQQPSRIVPDGSWRPIVPLLPRIARDPGRPVRHRPDDRNEVPSPITARRGAAFHHQVTRDYLMITEVEARATAEAVLAEINERIDFGPVVISEVEERSLGWIFYWTTARYLETGVLLDGMVGNAPILIERTTGAVLPTGTAYPIDHYIKEYEAGQDPSR
jgi:hypothetical protein